MLFTSGGFMISIETNWETTRRMGKIRYAAVSCQPKGGCPSWITDVCYDCIKIKKSTKSFLQSCYLFPLDTQLQQVSNPSITMREQSSG